MMIIYKRNQIDAVILSEVEQRGTKSKDLPSLYDYLVEEGDSSLALRMTLSRLGIKLTRRRKIKADGILLTEACQERE